MVKVYCDNGIFPQWLNVLQRESKVICLYFPYENKAKKIKQSIPSEITYNQQNVTFNMPDTTYNPSASDKYEDIRKIIGKQNNYDIIHLDTAYKNSCDCYITSDKDEFIECGKRQELEKLLQMKIFHQNEESEFKNFYCV